jgi:fructose-1,6-bisphosphatase I
MLDAVCPIEAQHIPVAYRAPMQAIASAARDLAAAIAGNGLGDALGAHLGQNSDGDRQAALDVMADAAFRTALAGTGVRWYASEEQETVSALDAEGDLAIAIDPLDGSSNIDVNISIGTIWSIHRKVSPGEDGTLADSLQPGYRQVAAGYVLYGSSTLFVYTTGKGVYGFTLDPTVGEFLLSHPDIRIPARGTSYSINEGNTAAWDPGTKAYVNSLKQREKPYSLRYVGTLVADFHRTLLRGGIFLYPSSPKPKLRLLYEAAPMAMIAEAAGGKATTGTKRILDIVPKELHEKVPLITGSPEDVAEYERELRR